MRGIKIRQVFFLLSIVATGHSRLHAQIPDETLECYSCVASEHDKMAADYCVDPVRNKVTLIKCINQLCMRLSGHSPLVGHRLQRGCGDENTTQPGCKELKPREGEETQRYACYCNQSQCNSERGLVVERVEGAEVMEIQVEGERKPNCASSFYLMREEINVFLYFTPAIGIPTLSCYLNTYGS